MNAKAKMVEDLFAAAKIERVKSTLLSAAKDIYILDVYKKDEITPQVLRHQIRRPSH